VKTDIFLDLENGRVMFTLDGVAFAFTADDAASLGLKLLCVSCPEKAGQLRAILPDVER
jgi:hypothetical protein